MKTAMQELIETLESQGLEMFGMEEFLEKEKQQIINAQNYSQRGVTGEIYYEMTFKND